MGYKQCHDTNRENYFSNSFWHSQLSMKYVSIIWSETISLDCQLGLDNQLCTIVAIRSTSNASCKLID